MTGAEDELMLLWRQGTSSAPDPAEVARLAARASMRRFDRLIARRNVVETVAAFGVLVFFGWRLAAGDDRVSNGISVACVSFVIAYLWWQHRHEIALDTTADAEAYHAALLARLDRQIALLRTVPYWYLLPLYVPMILTGVPLWQKNAAATVAYFAVVTAVYVAIGVLNVRVGVPRLLAERARLQALYQE
jgi:hypothetical protein